MVQWHTSKPLWTQQESFFFASVHEGLARLVNHVMQWEAVRGVTLPSASVPSACWDTYISACVVFLNADTQTGLAVAVRGAEVQF